jgi:hypothetical protein
VLPVGPRARVAPGDGCAVTGPLRVSTERALRYTAGEGALPTPAKEGKLGSSRRPPADAVASNEEGKSVSLSLDAFESTDNDVPLGPGSHPIVGKSDTGESKPREFLADVGFGERAIFNATGGTLKSERFETKRVAGAFTLDATGMVRCTPQLHVEGTFDIPCRGGMLESACEADKAKR